MTSATVPAIPSSLAGRPTINGLAIPWVNIRLGDGGVDFRGTHHRKWLAAWTQRLCQVCGNPLVPRDGSLGTSVVLAGSLDRLTTLLFDEPPMHGEGAAYVSRACPMVAGHQARYADRRRVSEGPRGRRCFKPGCRCGGWVAHDEGTGKDGLPVDGWFGAWVDDYTVAVDPAGEVIGGVAQLDQVLAVRLISTPAQGRLWRRISLDDVRAGYTGPDRARPAHDPRCPASSDSDS